MIEKADTSKIEEIHRCLSLKNLNHHKQTTFQQHLPTKPHHSDETEVSYTSLPKQAFNTKRGRHFHPMIKGESQFSKNRGHRPRDNLWTGSQRSSKQCPSSQMLLIPISYLHVATSLIQCRTIRIVGQVSCYACLWSVRHTAFKSANNCSWKVSNRNKQAASELRCQVNQHNVEQTWTRSRSTKNWPGWPDQHRSLASALQSAGGTNRGILDQGFKNWHWKEI